MATKKVGTVNTSKKSEKESMSIQKYFQYHGEHIHKYTQAFLGVTYRDIMKTKKEWDQEVGEDMEGNK